MNTIRKLGVAIFGTAIFALTTHAQENSPYTRYGLGDVQSGTHIATRGMGGIGVAYADGQIVNFSNPAALSNLRLVTYDLAVSIDSRTLVNTNPFLKYTSSNFSPAYVAIGVPVNIKKGVGMAIGFRPLTKVNYSILQQQRTSIDSMQTLYEGSGGFNQVFVGIGKKWKGLSVGVMTGYNFGRKETSTKRTFANDTVAYYKADYAYKTTFSGVFLKAGISYDFMIDSGYNKNKNTHDRIYLRFGASGTLKQQMQGTQNSLVNTFVYDASGAQYTLDSVYVGPTNRGKVIMPATYAAGVLIQKTSADGSGVFDLWSIGAEYTTTQWQDYSFLGQKDPLVNSWQLKLGGQWMPNPKDVKKYFNRVNYRAGFNIGKDYVNADGKGLKTYGVSVGFGLPVRPARFSYQFTTLNLSFEFGKRGSSINNVTENYFKLGFGLSLSDIWFIKRKYD